MQVAKYAIRKLEKGKFYIVPGIDVKLARFGAKIAPSNFVAKITYKVQKKKNTRLCLEKTSRVFIILH